MKLNPMTRILLKIIKFVYYAFLGLLVVLIVLVIGELMSVKQYKLDSSQAFELKGEYYESAQQSMVNQRFHKNKLPNEFRVFVIGGSQAMGSPYVTSRFDKISTFFNLLVIPNKGGISSWLEEYFKIIYPKKTVNVINASGGGQDSKWVFQTFREVKEKGDPDLVIILSGNNERNDDKIIESWTVDNINDFTDVLSKLTAQYKKHILAIANESIDSGFLVYFLTVPTKIRDHHPHHPKNFNFYEMQDLWYTGQHDKVLNNLKKDIYKNNSLAHFYTAKTYDELQEYDLARKHYFRAKDLDWSFVRSRSQWNDIIRNLKSSNHKIIDMEKKILDYADDHIPGNDLFLDYCHLNLRGNQIVAYEIVKVFILDQEINSQLSHKLKQKEIKIFKPWQLKVLYTIKMLKWMRLKYYARRTHIDAENSQNIINNYRRALEDVNDAENLLYTIENNRMMPMNKILKSDILIQTHDQL